MLAFDLGELCGDHPRLVADKANVLTRIGVAGRGVPAELG
jgi:hypothetical protein